MAISYLSVSDKLVRIDCDKEQKNKLIAIGIANGIQIHPTAYFDTELKLFYANEIRPVVMKFLSKLNELAFVDINDINALVFDIWAYCSDLKNSGSILGSLERNRNGLDILSSYTPANNCDMLVYEIGKLVESSNEHYPETAM